MEFKKTVFDYKIDNETKYIGKVPDGYRFYSKIKFIN